MLICQNNVSFRPTEDYEEQTLTSSATNVPPLGTKTFSLTVPTGYEYVGIKSVDGNISGAWIANNTTITGYIYNQNSSHTRNVTTTMVVFLRPI